MGTPCGAILGVMPDRVGSGGRTEAYFIGQPARRKLITDFQEGDGAHFRKDAEATGFRDGVEMSRFQFFGEAFAEQTNAHDAAVQDALCCVSALEQEAVPKFGWARGGRAILLI